MNEHSGKNNSSGKKVILFFVISLSIFLTAYTTYSVTVSSQQKKIESEKGELKKQIINLQNTINSMNQEISEYQTSFTEKSVKQSSFLDRANNVLLAVKNKDMTKLASFVHPDKGIRFSPYAYVDVKKDIHFTAVQVSNLINDNKKYIWGSYDGTGDPIELTFEEYYNKFIYNKDYINAEIIGNNRIIGKGNTINNAFEVYSESTIIEFHFTGFNPEYKGIDWESLRLVFEKNDGVWYLTGIIHDQWTI